MRFLRTFGLMLLLSMTAWGQELSVAEYNAQHGFNDTIDRQAPDFIKVGLVVAEPGEVLYTVLGHAALHLQCPAFDLDYVYSVESENVPRKVMKFLFNRLRMGTMMMSLEEYLRPYANEGRGVKEYPLNLPPEVKMELWRICDEMVEKGDYAAYDPVKRGCAVSIVHRIDEAINAANRKNGTQYQIDYASWGNKGKRTIREIFYQNAPKGWGLFWCMTIVAGHYVDDSHIPLREKMISPAEVKERWLNATIDGQPLIAGEIGLLPAESVAKAEAFSPIWFGLLVLLLAIACLFLKKNGLDYALLTLYAVFAFLITYLVVMPLPNTDWNWLIIPFNILPVLCWRWRRYWALPYAGIILLWCIAMSVAFLMGTILVGWSHILLALSFAILLLKQRFAVRR